MAIKERFVDLVLRVKNMMSSGTDEASASVKNLADSAEGLQQQLRDLEDQKTLISNFSKAEKAVDRTSGAYDRAKTRLGRLTDTFDQTGPLTEEQARQFEVAQRAVEKAEREYDQAGKTMNTLAKEAKNAGVDLTDLSGAQRENAKQATAAKRALQDYNEKVDDGDSRIKSFSKSLGAGAAKFVAWGAAAAAAAAAFGITVITRFTASQADLARETLAQADAFGISAEALQKWKYASKEVGIEGDKTADIMKDVAEKIGEAFATGGGEAAEVLDQLGLSADNLIKLRPDEQLLAIAKEIEGLPKPQQIQILESMASDASVLLPLLENNAKGLRDLSAAAEERGQIMTDEDLEALKDVDSAFQNITARVQGFWKEIAIRLAPAFEKMATALDEALGNKPELVDKISASISKLVQGTVEFVEKGVSGFDTVRRSAQTLLDTFQFLGNTGLGAFRLIQGGVSALLTLVSGVITGISKMVENVVWGMNKIGLASDDALRGARERTQELVLVTKGLADQTVEYGEKAWDAGVSALTAFDNTTSAVEKVGAAVAGTVDDLHEIEVVAKRLDSSIDGVAGSVEALGASQEVLSKQIVETVKAIEAASAAWNEDPSDENLARLDELRERYDALQKALADLKIPAVEGAEGLKADLDGITDRAMAAGDAVQGATTKIDSMGDSVQRSGESIEKVGDAAEDTAEKSGNAIADIFSGWSSRLAGLSESAAAEFNRALGDRGVAGTADALANRMEEVNNQISTLRHSVGAGGLTGAMLEVADAGLTVERQFLSQASAAENLTQRIQDGERGMSVLSMSAEQVQNRFSLLDDTRLTNLIGSVQSVQREVDGLKQSLDDTIASAKQELAALQGDTAEVERLRYQEKSLELQEQLNYARQVGDQEAVDKAKEALSLADEAHKIRLAAAEQQADAAREQAAAEEARTEQERQRSEVEERQDISLTETRTQAQTNQASSPRLVQVQFIAPSGESLGTLNALDDSSVDRLLQSLEFSQLVSPG